MHTPSTLSWRDALDAMAACFVLKLRQIGAGYLD
jgi:hypothetical protein